MSKYIQMILDALHHNRYIEIYICRKLQVRAIILRQIFCIENDKASFTNNFLMNIKSHQSVWFGYH